MIQSALPVCWARVRFPADIAHSTIAIGAIIPRLYSSITLRFLFIYLYCLWGLRIDPVASCYRCGVLSKNWRHVVPSLKRIRET